jgi:SAM-dependent methyltransferase
VGTSFEELISEAEAAPIDGWDFSWLSGRATEVRPSWGYSRLVAQRYATASSALDLQSGGGEMLAALPGFPRLMVATEGYGPNVAVAARRLEPLGAHVVACNDDRPALPFADGSFALVTSRHPIVAWWQEIARVLQPGGSYLSQEVGPHSMRALSEFMMGPLPDGSKRKPGLARKAAEAAGLSVVDLRSETLRTVFYDIGAVVYYLRLVVWIVPGFTVGAYRDRLLALHEQIGRDGYYEATASRFIIEASKPG